MKCRTITPAGSGCAFAAFVWAAFKGAAFARCFRAVRATAGTTIAATKGRPVPASVRRSISTSKGRSRAIAGAGGLAYRVAAGAGSRALRAGITPLGACIHLGAPVIHLITGTLWAAHLRDAVVAGQFRKRASNVQQSLAFHHEGFQLLGGGQTADHLTHTRASRQRRHEELHLLRGGGNGLGEIEREQRTQRSGLARVGTGLHVAQVALAHQFPLCRPAIGIRQWQDALDGPKLVQGAKRCRVGDALTQLNRDLVDSSRAFVFQNLIGLYGQRRNAHGTRGGGFVLPVLVAAQRVHKRERRGRNQVIRFASRATEQVQRNGGAVLHEARQYPVHDLAFIDRKAVDGRSRRLFRLCGTFAGTGRLLSPQLVRQWVVFSVNTVLLGNLVALILLKLVIVREHGFPVGWNVAVTGEHGFIALGRWRLVLIFFIGLTGFLFVEILGVIFVGVIIFVGVVLDFFVGIVREVFFRLLVFHFGGKGIVLTAIRRAGGRAALHAGADPAVLRTAQNGFRKAGGRGLELGVRIERHQTGLRQPGAHAFGGEWFALLMPEGLARQLQLPGGYSLLRCHVRAFRAARFAAGVRAGTTRRKSQCSGARRLPAFTPCHASVIWMRCHPECSCRFWHALKGSARRGVRSALNRLPLPHLDTHAASVQVQMRWKAR